MLCECSTSIGSRSSLSSTQAGLIYSVGKCVCLCVAYTARSS